MHLRAKFVTHKLDWPIFSNFGRSSLTLTRFKEQNTEVQKASILLTGSHG